MKSKIIIMVLGLLLVLFAYSFSQVPQLINYQGKLTKVTGAPLDTTVQMIFSIYADSNGTILNWTETQVVVKVEKGIFNVLLGSVSPIPDTVFNGNIRYLGVKVGVDPEITPRKPMVSVPYAYRAGSIQTNCHDCDSILVNVTGPDSVIAAFGTAFLGKASGNSSFTMGGIEGYADNASNGDANGGYFSTSSAGTGSHCGVSAYARSSANMALGLLGWGTSYSTGSAYGVRGIATNTFTGSVFGGWFYTEFSGTGTHFGVMAEGNGSSSNPVYGCYGFAENASSGSA